MPDLPLLSSDPTVIVVADVIRTLMLIVGCAVAAISYRSVRAVGHQAGPALLRGFAWRSWALVIGALYVCLHAYDRLGDAVTMQLPVGVTYLSIALFSTHLAITHPGEPSETERRLTDWDHRRLLDDD